MERGTSAECNSLIWGVVVETGLCKDEGTAVCSPWSGLIGQVGWPEDAAGSDHLKIPPLLIKNLFSPKLIDVFLS